MSRFEDLSDHELDRLLAGKAPLEGEEFEDLVAFVQDLRATYPEEAVGPATQARHLTAIVGMAHLLAEKGDLTQRSGSKAVGPARQASGLPKWRRRPVLRKMFAPLAAKVAVAVVALLTAFSGLAVAGTLPRPLQSFAADAASLVGVDLPNPDEAAVVTDRGDDQGEDQAEESDDQGEDQADHGDQNDGADSRSPSEED